IRRSSSTRSCSISACQSWKLAVTTISPSISCFSLEASSITSPFSTVVLFQTGPSRVEDTTYLGMLFNRSANGPFRDGHPGGQELVAPPTQQKGLGAQRLVECHSGRLFATLAANAIKPAAEPETLDAGRVLDDSVERDVLADDDPSHFRTPSRWSCSVPRDRT